MQRGLPIELLPVGISQGKITGCVERIQAFPALEIRYGSLGIAAKQGIRPCHLPQIHPPGLVLNDLRQAGCRSTCRARTDCRLYILQAALQLVWARGNPQQGQGN